MAREVLIGNILKRIKRPVQLIDDQDYKLVTIKMNHKGIVLREIKKGAEIKSGMYEVREGDFILSGIDARNGAFGIVPAELDGAIVTNDFWYFEIDKSVISKKLFLELTATSWFDEICKRGSDGTTQRIRLQKDKFFNQSILLPDEDEQDQLLYKLLAIKEKQKALASIIQNQKKLLSQLKLAILQEAIQGILTEDWRAENPEVEPASELLLRIRAEKEKLVNEKKIKKDKSLVCDNDITSELPDGWVWCRLGEICHKIHYGLSVSAKPDKKEYKLLRITDIQNNKVNWETVPGCEHTESDVQNFLLNNNDILIARTGGTIGKTFLVSQLSHKSLFASYLIRAVPSPLYLAEYLKYFMESPVYWKQLFEASWGAGQPNVNGTSLSKLNIILPPLEEQRYIVQKINKLIEKCQPLEAKIIQSEAHAQMLMEAVLKEAFEPNVAAEPEAEVCFAMAAESASAYGSKGKF